MLSRSADRDVGRYMSYFELNAVVGEGAFLGVEGGEGFGVGAVERAGVDDGGVVDLVVAGDVGVAVEDVVDLEGVGIEQGVLE